LNETTIYFVIASACSIVFLIRLMVVAIRADRQPSADGLRFFSVQSLLAFGMGFGWTGLGGMNDWKLSRPATAMLSLAVGTAFLALAACLDAKINRLISEGKAALQKCIGQTATVTTAIPEKSAGTGRITVAVNGRNRTLRARSTGGPIESQASVRLVEVVDDEQVTVEPSSSQPIPSDG
jgi:hypothetical protein